MATATLPELPAGVYTLQVINPGGASAAAAATVLVTLRGPNKILEHAAAPNPLAGAQGYIAVKLEGNADLIRIKIYTKSMVVVSESEVARDADGHAFHGAGWSRLNLPPDFLADAANGQYYYRLTSLRNDGPAYSSPIGRLMVLR
jgi:hypothetical protein